MEEDIKQLESLIKSMNLNRMLNVTIFPEDKKALENLIKGYRELEEENKQLKARLIQTHNRASIEKKTKLYDVIDNSIDRYLESSKTILKNELMEDK